MIVPHAFFSKFQSISYIQYGPFQANVECLGHHKDSRTIYISSTLKEKINLSKHKKINITLGNGKCTIKLCLGVFIAGFESNEILGPRTDLFEHFSMIGDRLGYQTIFFGYQHISYDKRKIYAYFYDNGKWKRDWFYFPSVVYNRIPNRKTEHHPEVIKAKAKVIEHSYLFNHDFFNKWEIYELLRKDQVSSYLLPETILHPSPKKVIELLQQHAIYIKPIHGSLGNGIVKCRQLATGELESHYYHKEIAQVNRYTSFSSFFQQHFPNGFKGYVVQLEIPLLKKDGKAIDFRVHVNKNNRNSWEVTLSCAKYAGKGSLTTHVQRGGSLHTIEELFGKEKAKRMHKKLASTAILLSNALEKNFHSPIGEIGYDLGMDEEGKVWLFEANAKPGFSIFDHPELNEKAPKVFSYIFKYSFYLHNLRMNSMDNA